MSGGSGTGRNGSTRYICWDLDETLGDFRDYSNLKLRKGIQPLLEGLSKLGLRHVVTTAACREHAEYALTAGGMRHMFDGIFPYDRICDGEYVKHYLPVAAELGIHPLEAPARVLVTGDLWRDAPADLDLTFVYQPFGCDFNAGVYMNIIMGLLDASESWERAHSLLWTRNIGQYDLDNFAGGTQVIENITVGVGRIRLLSPENRSPNRIVAVMNIPESYRSEAEIIKTEIKNENGYSACTEPVTVATASLSGASG